MKKRSLRVLSLLCAALCVLHVTAFATDFDGYTVLKSGTTTLSAGKKYYLTSDVTNSKVIKVNGSGNVTLDLNGHNLGQESGTQECVIKVESGAVLTLKDSAGGGTVTCGRSTYKDLTVTYDEAQKTDVKLVGGIYVAGGGTLNFESGKLQSCIGYTVGGVYVASNGVFNMSGGEIYLCQAMGDESARAGGVMIETGGEFSLTDGKLSWNVVNSTENSAGCIYNKGTCTIGGGNVSSGLSYDKSSEQTKTYYSITNDGADACKLILNNGVVESVNNKVGTVSGNGTAMDVEEVINSGTIDGAGFDSACTLTNNGTIKNIVAKCSVTGDGDITGGTFSGDVTCNGDITGGTFSGDVLSKGFITGGTFSGEVTCANDHFKSPATTTGNGKVTTYPALIFDTLGGSKVVLQLCDNVNGVKPENPELSGYAFGGWSIGDDYTTEWDFDTVVTENVTLKAKWYKIVETEKELNDAISSGEHFIRVPVTTDINLTETIVIDNQYVVLDVLGEIYAPDSETHAIKVKNGGILTLKTAYIVFGAAYVRGCVSVIGSTLIVQSVYIESVLAYDSNGKNSSVYLALGQNKELANSGFIGNLTMISGTLYADAQMVGDCSIYSEATVKLKDSDSVVTEFLYDTTNCGTIEAGDFIGAVTNWQESSIISGMYSTGTIKGGSFVNVDNTHGVIEGGTFTGDITNGSTGVVRGGDFSSATSLSGVYTVNFDLNGASGTVPATQWRANAPATKPSVNPVRSGYIFKGWYNGSQEYTFTEDVTESITLKAEFGEPETYTLTYNLDGGTATNPSSYTVESGDFTLNNPTKDGFEFIGWSGTDLNGENNMFVTVPKGSVGNRTYTAHWKEIKSEAQTVSVEISWDSMEFTYTDGEWSTQTHSYANGKWDSDGGNVTVKNNSTVDISATFTMTSATEDITGDFSKQSVFIAINNSDSSKLSLSGKPSSEMTGVSLGTVTVSVKKIVGWIENGSSKYYYRENGEKATGWLALNGNYYYLNPNSDGAMAIGWVQINGEYHYFGTDGIRQNVQWNGET